MTFQLRQTKNFVLMSRIIRVIITEMYGFFQDNITEKTKVKEKKIGYFTFLDKKMKVTRGIRKYPLSPFFEKLYIRGDYSDI